MTKSRVGFGYYGLCSFHRINHIFWRERKKLSLEKILKEGKGEYLEEKGVGRKGIIRWERVRGVYKHREKGEQNVTVFTVVFP